MLLPCGCIMFLNGDTFYVNPCSEDCEYYKYALEKSKKRGNKIKKHVVTENGALPRM